MYVADVINANKRNIAFAGNCEMHGIYIKIHSIQISPVKDIQTCIHGMYTIPL